VFRACLRSVWRRLGAKYEVYEKTLTLVSEHTEIVVTNHRRPRGITALASPPSSLKEFSLAAGLGRGEFCPPLVDRCDNPDVGASKGPHRFEKLRQLTQLIFSGDGLTGAA
jgi:hypothetical protein